MAAAFAPPDPDSDFGARFARRMNDDLIAWLTVVDPRGVPQPAPVWFRWDPATGTAVIYNQPSAHRLARITSNPNAALHLNDDGRGSDVITVLGTLAVDASQPAADDNPAYRAKYDELIAGTFGTPRRFADMFNVATIFTATKARGH
jgi:PPOX class probable F420-dependent enzyme